MSFSYLPCRVCGGQPSLGVLHHHHATCDECGIEVWRTSEGECRAIWNWLMGPELPMMADDVRS